MQLREYQEAALEAIREGFRDHRSVCIVLATGLGKTVTFGMLGATWDAEDGRVLAIAHRGELVEQMDEQFREMATFSGKWTLIEMAERKVPHGYALYGKDTVVVASLQTLCQPKRLRQFNPHDYGLIIIDECHHATSPSYRRILEHFYQNPKLKVLGVTATPMRSDKVRLGSIFEKVVYEFGMKAGIDEGYLVNIKQHTVTVEGLDFSTVERVGGDFDMAALEEILIRDRPMAEVAAGIAAIVPKTDAAIVFCAGVKHSRKLAEMLNMIMGHGIAEHVDGTMDKQMRKEIIDGFKKGNFSILCNCDVLIEGFNAPRTKYVILARPIGHLGRYTQILGRGTRTYPAGIIDQPGMTREDRLAAIAASEKPHLTVLDFKGNAGKHRVIDTIDIFAGNDPPEVQEIARTLVEQGKGQRPTQDAIDTARLLHEVFSEQPEVVHQIVAKAAKVHQQEVDVFDPDVMPAYRERPQHDPATQGQIRYLIFLGFPAEKAAKLSKRQASGLIGKLKRERGE